MEQHNEGKARPSGSVQHRVIRQLGDLERRPPVAWTLTNLVNRFRGRGGIPAQFLGRVSGCLMVQPVLTGVVYRAPWDRLDVFQAHKLRALLAANTDVRELAAAFGGTFTDYGVLSTRVVTDTGVAFIVDAFQNIVELETMQFHGYGTGTTAEAASQTALVTELTTEYAADNTRPTGSRTEGAANVYRSVGTLSPDGSGTLAITEHGLFSQAATGGGVMLDRSVFAAVNLTRGADSLQTTYDLTLASGG